MFRNDNRIDEELIDVVSSGDRFVFREFLVRNGWHMFTQEVLDEALTQSINIDITRRLLEMGADANASRALAIETAIIGNDVDAVQLLIDNGANPRLRHFLGTTIRYHPDDMIMIAEILLANGAEANDIDLEEYMEDAEQDDRDLTEVCTRIVLERLYPGINRNLILLRNMDQPDDYNNIDEILGAISMVSNDMIYAILGVQGEQGELQEAQELFRLIFNLVEASLENQL